MATRMQQRRGTAAQWTSANPVLGAGEIGFETNTGKFKIGDGSTTWTNLEYFITIDDSILSIVNGAPAALDTLNELAAALGDDANYATTVTNALAEKAPTASPTFTGSVTLPSTTAIGEVSSTEIGYVNGVTSSIQTQIDSKQATITGGATTIVSTDLAVSRALESNDSGKVAVSAVTSTELGYLSGVTSGIQAQIDGKLATSTASSTYAPLSGPTFTGTVTLPSTTSIGDVSATELGYLNNVTSAIQTQLDAKAPTASPTFTGTVSGITKAMVDLGNADNTSDANKPVSTAQAAAIATAKAEAIADATSQVNAVIASAPAALNTLDELAAALNDDANFATTVTNNLATKAPINDPTFTGLVTVSSSGVAFSDGTQTKQGVPSITTISQKTDSYTLGALTERDTIIEVSKASATTVTIPTDATLNFPVGTTLDIIQTGAGQVTIAGASGVTVNATPGLKLRAQWSSATLLKRAANSWLVFGDLSS
jgi:hypothetical protein